jgi:hypothetical protein
MHSGNQKDDPESPPVGEAARGSIAMIPTASGFSHQSYGGFHSTGGYPGGGSESTVEL